MAVITIYSDFGAPQIKSTIVSTVSPSICDKVMVFLYVYIDKIFSEEKLFEEEYIVTVIFETHVPSFWAQWLNCDLVERMMKQ